MHSIHLFQSDHKGSDTVTVLRNRFLVILFIALLLSACSKGGIGHGTGGISFTLKMSSQEASMPQYKAAVFPCADYPDSTIEAQVRNNQETLVATGGPWSCDAGEGVIRNVDEGDNHIISVSLKDAGGNVIFRGSKGGLQVAAGQITDAGTIELISSNNPPVFEGIPSQQVNEGQPLTPFTISATDPDGDTLTYSAISLPTGATFDPATRIFSWTPGFDQSGNFTASFQVTDNGTPPRSATLNVTITVGNVNRPPVLSPIGIQHFTLLSPGFITLSATDPDGNTLTYDVAGMASPFGIGYLHGSSIDPKTHVFTWDPGSNDYSPGEYKALIRVIDNGTPMMCAYQWVTIQVYNSSPTEIDGLRFPVLAPIASRQISVGQLLQFTISATDSDPNATLVYSANPISGKTYPTGSSFSLGTRQFLWSNPGPAGNYWVRFIANDNHDMANQQQVFEDVVFTVGNVNRPPVLDPIGARDVVMGNTLQFVVTATDPENNSLTYTADLSELPGSGASFNPATQTFSWSVPPYDGSIQHSSIYTVRFTVTDNGTPQESDYEDVQILVE
jgi:hypothetical protein